MHNDIEKILLSKEKLQGKINELGKKIAEDYKDTNPVLICILRGSAIFTADLVRAIEAQVEMDFMSISSYGASTQSSGVVKIRKDIDTDITDRHVIIVEDIVDSGLTLKYLLKYLSKHKPASLKACVLLDKPEAHKADLHLEYVGFEVGNEFVVGYGLDFAEKYRNLPYIGILKEEVYK